MICDGFPVAFYLTFDPKSWSVYVWVAVDVKPFVVTQHGLDIADLLSYVSLRLCWLLGSDVYLDPSNVAVSDSQRIVNLGDLDFQFSFRFLDSCNSIVDVGAIASSVNDLVMYIDQIDNLIQYTFGDVDVIVQRSYVDLDLD